MERSKKMIYISTIILVFVSRTTSDCGCDSFGGLCIKDSRGRELASSCEYSANVSKGIYEDDGYTIVDHCRRNGQVCGKGECVPTFGAYYCRCPKGSYGMHCHLNDPGLDGVDNRFWVYYQAQPAPGGTQYFTVVYDLLNYFLLPQEEITQKGVIILSLSTSDGRKYYPSKHEMTNMNPKENCTLGAEQSPKRFDRRVCNYLPDEVKAVFTIKTVSSDPITDNSRGDLVYVPGLEGPAGRTIIVSVKIEWHHEEGVETLYRADYTTFTYYSTRIEYNCLVDLDFTGCSRNPERPVQHPRGAYVAIQTNKRIISCKGAAPIGFKWHLQTEVDHPFVPFYPSESRPGIPMTILPTDERIRFIRLYFYPGLHMIEFEYVFRGTPPHYGGTTLFQKTSRCWIQIISGPLMGHTTGGTRRTASCYTPLTLNFQSTNPSYRLKDLAFMVSCDRRSDKECKETMLTVPVYTKTNSDCNVVYTFDVLMINKLDDTMFKEMKVHINFVWSDVALTVHCLFNCYPIDPSYRVLVYASTEPYVPHKVEWNVTVDGHPMNRPHQIINAFQPLSASRISRIKGRRFSRPGQVASEVAFNVSGRGKKFYSYKVTESNNLSPIVDSFELMVEPTKPGYFKFARKNKTLQFNYLPVRFRVYQLINPLTRGPMLFLKDTNYEDDIIFKPNWRRVQLCVTDASNTEFCHRWATVTGKLTNNTVSFEQLQDSCEAGHTSNCLSAAVIALHDGVSSTYPMSWKIPPSTRIAVLKLVMKTKHHTMLDLMTLSHLLSILFYTASGNRDESLQAFKDDFSMLSNFKGLFDWVDMQRLSLSLLATCFTELREQTSDPQWSGRPSRLQGGDILNEMIKVWSLAHAQTSFMRQFQDTTDIEFRDFVGAELDFRVRETQRLLNKGLGDFMRSMTNFAHLFYGLRNIGMNSVQAWFTKTSYQGVLAVLNKSVTPAESELGYVDYVFGTSIFQHSLWFKDAELEFPENCTQLINKEVSLVVMIARGRGEHERVSPQLFIALYLKNGDSLNQLPQSLLYNITLPKTRDVRTMVQFKFEPPPGDTSKYYPYTVFKVTLPTRYVDYKETLFFNLPVSPKVKISYDYLPLLEDVENEPTIKTKHNRQTLLQQGTIDLDPRSGESLIPQVFYMGILIDKGNYKGRPVTMHLKKDVEVCISQPIGSDESEKCSGILENQRVAVVECRCRLLGLVYAIPEKIHREVIVPNNWKFRLPTTQKHQRDYILLAVLALILLMLYAYGLISDWRRHKMNLIYMEDTYPGDRHLYAIGVNTSVRLYAGSRSTVAIKLIGNASSSRVHLLKTTSRKTLRGGEDDWFVMATKAHLGKIVQIEIWHDFHHLSDWCCSRVYIHDLGSSRWYLAIVNRWFRLTSLMSSAELRKATIPVQELESVDGVILSLPYKFSSHWINELRDRHIIASLLFWSNRSLSAVEHATTIIIIKVLTMSVWSSFVLEQLYASVYGIHFDGESSKTIINLGNRTLSMALFIAIVSRPATLPLRIAYRSFYKSRLLQKKVTNPTYMQVVHLEELVTEVKPAELVSHIREKQRKSFLAKESSKTKHVGFELEADTGRTSRRLTRIISDVVLKKIAWTKKAALEKKKNFRKNMLQIMGPVQFRCVNISNEAFKIKTRKRTLTWRTFAGLLIVVLFLALGSLVILTDFGHKLEAASFLIAVALIFDIFIIDPSIIALNSFFMFYILKVTNKESYLWHEETRASHPKPLSHADYLRRITKNRIYRPLLSSEIDAKRKNEDVWSLAKAIAYYLCSILSIYCCVVVVEDTFQNSYFCNVKSKASILEEPNNQLRRPSFEINQVFTFDRAKQYLLTNVADMQLAWYNGKNITENKERSRDRRWSRDFVSKPVGASRLILVFLSEEGGMARIMKLFSNIFSDAQGYLSDGKQEKAPISLGGEKLQYMGTGYGTVMGKSREYYPLRGHNSTLQMLDFRPNYFKLLAIMGDLSEYEYQTNLRAIIWTTNHINVFARRVITVNSIIEFLPSGIASARYEISTFLAFSEVRHIIVKYERLLLVLLVFHFVLTVSSAVKTGLKKYYLRSIVGVINLLIYPAAFCCWFFELFSSQLTASDTLSNLRMDTYYDLNHVYVIENCLAFVRLSIIGGLIIDVVLGVWAMSSSSRTQWPLVKITHWCLAAFVLQLFIGLAANLGKSIFENRVAILNLFFHIRGLQNTESGYEPILWLATIFTFCIFQGMSMAIFIKTRLRSTIITPSSRLYEGRLTGPIRRLVKTIRPKKRDKKLSKSPERPERRDSKPPETSPIEARASRANRSLVFFL